LMPAGVILFGRNTATVPQTRALTNELRAAFGADLEPIVAIDQEGGRVMRLRDGVEEIPSMMALAAAGDVDLARKAGEQIAFDLRRMGVNLNFAPVIDLALHRNNTVIGARSFGDDPLRVTTYARAIAEGMRAYGVVPTFKHFPGHGSTELDSHVQLPAIDADERTVRSRDLVPFEKLLPSAQAVMSAHVALPALDAQHPATLSQAILTGLLRDELNFGGVCFTDCLEMNAIAKTVGTSQGAVEALSAGADCVLVSHSLDVARAAIDAIVAAASDGTLPLLRLEEANARVHALRERLCPPLPLEAHAPHGGIGTQIGRRAVTVIRGAVQCDPAASVVVSFEGATTEGVVGTHSVHAPLTSLHPQLHELRLPLEPNDAEVSGMLLQLSELRKRPIALSRRAHLHRSQAAAIEAIFANAQDGVLAAVREPFDAFEIASARNALCTYGDDAPSIAGLADVLFSGVPATGTLPISLAPLS